MLTIDEPAVAFVSWGLWVARCPQPWCVGIDHYGPGPNTGRIGGLGPDRFCCPRCGTVTEAQWPANRDDIELVLGRRPMPETRNWQPGETLGDLVVENALHGLDLDKVAVGVRMTNDLFTDRTMLAGKTLLAIGG